MTKITKQTVKHVAQLASIPLKKGEATSLQAAFAETLDVVDQLQKLDVSRTEPTHQVTGLKNILRQDKVEEKCMFTQKQALANAKQAHNGYLEIYLNLGLIGILLLLLLLGATYVNCKKKSFTNYDYYRYQIGLFSVIPLYNITEAAFKHNHIMWFLLLMISIRWKHASYLNSG